MRSRISQIALLSFTLGLLGCGEESPNAGGGGEVSQPAPATPMPTPEPSTPMPTPEPDIGMMDPMAEQVEEPAEPELPTFTLNDYSPPAELPPIDTTFITADFIGTIILHPRRISEAVVIKQLQDNGLPLESLLEIPRNALNIDPVEIEQFVLLFDNLSPESLSKLPELAPDADSADPNADPNAGQPNPNTQQQPPRRRPRTSARNRNQPQIHPPGMIVRFTEPFDQEEWLGRILENPIEKRLGSRTYHAFERRAIYIPDDRTLIVAEETQVRKMINGRGGQSPVVDQLEQAGPVSDLMIAFDFIARGETIDEIKQATEILPGLPGEAGIPGDLNTVPSVQKFTLSIDLTHDPLLRLIVRTENAETATMLNSLASVQLEMGRQQFRALLEEDEEADDDSGDGEENGTAQDALDPNTPVSSDQPAAPAPGSPQPPPTGAPTPAPTATPPVPGQPVPGQPIPGAVSPFPGDPSMAEPAVEFTLLLGELEPLIQGISTEADDADLILNVRRPENFSTLVLTLQAALKPFVSMSPDMMSPGYPGVPGEGFPPGAAPPSTP